MLRDVCDRGFGTLGDEAAADPRTAAPQYPVELRTLVARPASRAGPVEPPTMIEVRPAREEDLAAILAIYNDAIANTTAVFSYEPHTIEMRREWFAAKQVAGHPVLAAELDGNVIGFATYGPFRAWPAYKYTVEHSVYTAAGARRRGAGRLLMDALLAQAVARGYHTVVGGIVSENTASLKFHQALGFVEVAHFREVGFKFGRWLDLKFLQRLLPTPERPVDG